MLRVLLVQMPDVLSQLPTTANNDNIICRNVLVVFAVVLSKGFSASLVVM